MHPVAPANQRARELIHAPSRGASAKMVRMTDVCNVLQVASASHPL